MFDDTQSQWYRHLDLHEAVCCYWFVRVRWHVVWVGAQRRRIVTNCWRDADPFTTVITLTNHNRCTGSPKNQLTVKVNFVGRKRGKTCANWWTMSFIWLVESVAKDLFKPNTYLVIIFDCHFKSAPKYYCIVSRSTCRLVLIHCFDIKFNKGLKLRRLPVLFRVWTCL